MKDSSKIITIETPEHFELQFRLAGLGSRFIAYLVDKLIQLSVILGLILSVTILLYFLSKIAVLADIIHDLSGLISQWILAVAILCYGILILGYFILFEYFWGGATPGKKSQSIRVIRKDGRPVTFLDSAIRNVLRSIDILGEVYPLGFVVMFLDSRNRRLGDMAAGTLVIVDDQADQPIINGNSEQLPEADSELRGAIRQMSLEDLKLVTGFLERRKFLDPEVRSSLALKICRRVLKKNYIQGDAESILEQIRSLYLEKTRIF